MKNFKVMFDNIRGIKSKKYSLQKILNDEKPMVMCIAESHLKDGENFEIEGYKVERCDRKSSAGGGVMVIYDKQIQHMVTVVSEEDCEFEAMWMKVDNGRIAIKLGVIYMPQEDKTTVKKLQQIYKKIEKEIKKSVEENEHIVLMGDFNCRIGINEGRNNGEVTKGGKLLLGMAKKNGLCIVNKEEICKGRWTRILGREKSALDFVLIRKDDRRYLQMMSIDENKEITPFWVTNETERRWIYSDHCMITVGLNWIMKLQDEKPPKYMGKKGLETMSRELDDLKVSQIIQEDDFENTYEEWSRSILKIAEQNKKSRKQKKEWKCCRLLQKAKKNVNKLIKKEKNEEKREMLKKRKEYIDEYIDLEMKEKKRNKVDKIVEEIKKDGGVDSQTFWIARKWILGRKKETRYAIKDKNGVLKEKPEEIIKVYENFYDDLLNGRMKRPSNIEQDEHIKMMINGMEILNRRTPDPEMDEQDVEKVIKSLKMKKAGDKCGWKNEFLKCESEEMKKSLEKIFKIATKEQMSPAEWEYVLIKSICKKPPHNEMKNKRGLFLTSIVGKTYERVIKARNDERIWNGISESQTGGKKKRGPIDNVMVLLSIAERNKYLGKDTYITYTDIEKCFDNIWLDDSIVDIWMNGMHIRDAMMIRKMNERARATVVTPFGETEEFELKSTVKQGGVSSVALCCSSLDKVNKNGRKIVTMYGADIEINAQAFVDDIESAGSPKVANNTIYNCNVMEEEKQLTINTDRGKSAQMVIKSNKNNDNKTITEMVARGRIGSVQEYEFLGTWVDESAMYGINISKMKGEVQAMINETKQVGSMHEVGYMATQTRLKLLESAIMKSALYNVEAFPTITEEEIKDLEKVQHNILVQLLELPESTPYAGMLMETGLWMMEARVHYRKLMLYHNIVHSDDGRKIKNMIEFQKQYERRAGTWYSDVKRIIGMYDIIADVEKSLKSEWKREVKSKIGVTNQKRVVLKCKEGVKTRFICDDEWGRKKYLNNATTEDIRRVMKLRLCMIPVPCNQRRREEEPGCKLCGCTTKIRMEHYYTCPRLDRLRGNMNISSNLDGQLFKGPVSKLLKEAAFMETVSKLTVV